LNSDSTYANPASLVSTEWVAEHLTDPKVRMLEVDVDTTADERGHICCALGINWTTQLGDLVRRDIPSRSAFEHLMGQAGVSNDNHVIFYLPEGHARGGRGGDGTTMVDVRSPAEFNGEIIAPPGLPETAQRCGHIPGAHNIPRAQAANEDGTFKSPDELRTLYESKGISPDQPVIAYCRIGERSAHTWFVLKELLGHPNVHNYDGSWTEYGSVVGVPIDNPAAVRQPVPA
jgi:3-mercaptopyruvate sulfurtransferase SseA